MSFYYVKHEISGEIVELHTGIRGYFETDLSEEQAEALNRACGHSEADLDAATACSMFGNWDNFEHLRNKLSEIKNGR